jgi:hypothetical protein
MCVLDGVPVLRVSREVIEASFHINPFDRAVKDL